MCNGQLLPINQNQALFSLLGTTYGGDGQVNFALPNLQGKVPMHFGQSTGSNFALGQTGGEAAHTLTTPEMLSHAHVLVASRRTANLASPTGNLLGQTSASVARAAPVTPNTTLNPATVANAGGGQAHQNLQPYLALNFCIALQGIFPSRN